jgi:aspartyl-tRNA(Asn)/glutamyl-tRNA(Gln) amidotransferase subunit C
MALTPKDIEGIAHLSRLDLGEAELSRFVGQLEAILGYVEALNKLDLAGVEPTTHVSALENRLREDETRPTLAEPDVERMAPEFKAGSFRVPRIMEE